ncbi:MAG: TlpA family protein disulfide reductase [Chloroflexales bacterium]|nr:TlpA family protein disulfide reductase [Chloroflexales bacterium]
MRRPSALYLLVILTLLASCGAGGDPDEGLSIGRRLPDADLRALDGATLRVHDLRGQPAVLNFWATWCGPCREEIPNLEQASAAYQGQGVRFLAITDELRPEVRSFMSDIDMSLPVYFDNGGRAGKRYQVQSIPTTFFLDSEGYIIARHSGALSAAQLTRYLERLLQDTPEVEPPAQPDAPGPLPTAPMQPAPGDDDVGWRRPAAG